jgi:hypothetical protein
MLILEPVFDESSHSSVALKLSHIALSKQSPTEPIDGELRPQRNAFRMRSKCIGSLIGMVTYVRWAPPIQRHVERIERKFGSAISRSLSRFEYFRRFVGQPRTAKSRHS